MEDQQEITVEEEWVRPMGRNAAIWNHFKESKNDREQKKERIRVKCNHCPSIFSHSSSTSNYIRHMKCDHPSISIDVKKGSTTKGQEKSKQLNITAAFVRTKNEPLGKVSNEHLLRQCLNGKACSVIQTLSLK